MQTYPVKENNLVPYHYPELRDLIESSVLPNYDERYLIMDNFRNECKNWLESGTKTIIKNLNRFKYVYVLNGVSQYVTDLVKFEDRHIEMHNSEYLGYKTIVDMYKLPHEYKDSYSSMGKNAENLVIVSYPASLLGNDDNSLKTMLYDSKSKITLDSVFLGTNTFPVSLDFNELTNVETFLFSFSKGFNLSYHRVGIMFTDKYIPEYDVLHSYAYLNLNGMNIARKIMKEFNIDYFSDTYQDKQLKICKQLEIEPSGCVHLGLDPDMKNPDRKIKITHLFDSI